MTLSCWCWPMGSEEGHAAAGRGKNAWCLLLRMRRTGPAASRCLLGVVVLFGRRGTCRARRPSLRPGACGGEGAVSRRRRAAVGWQAALWALSNLFSRRWC